MRRYLLPITDYLQEKKSFASRLASETSKNRTVLEICKDTDCLQLSTIKKVAYFMFHNIFYAL